MCMMKPKKAKNLRTFLTTGRAPYATLRKTHLYGCKPLKHTTLNKAARGIPLPFSFDSSPFPFYNFITQFVSSIQP
jgi:hypothetical protein